MGLDIIIDKIRDTVKRVYDDFSILRKTNFYPFDWVLRETAIEVQLFFRSKSKMSTYAFKVAKNICLREKKRYERLHKMDQPLEIEGMFPEFPFASTAESHNEDNELERKLAFIKQCLETLPEQHRIPLILHCYHGMTYQEIADELDIPLGSVKAFISRARKRMRKLYKDFDTK